MVEKLKDQFILMDREEVEERINSGTGNPLDFRLVVVKSSAEECWEGMMSMRQVSRLNTHEWVAALWPEGGQWVLMTYFFLKQEGT